MVATSKESAAKPSRRGVAEICSQQGLVLITRLVLKALAACAESAWHGKLTPEVVGGSRGGALARSVHKLGAEAFSVPAIANGDTDGAARVNLPVIGLQQGTGYHS